MNPTHKVAFVTAVTDEGSESDPDQPTNFCKLAKPAAVETGDFMLVAIGTPIGNGVVAYPPDGWTLITRVDNAAASGLLLYYKFALDEPDHYVWGFFDLPGESLGVDVTYVGVLHVYRNVWDFAPVDAFAGKLTASGTSQALPSLRNASESEPAVVGFWTQPTSNTWTAPTNWRERAETSNTDGAAAACSIMGADRFPNASTWTTMLAAAAPTATASGAAVGCSAFVYLTPTRDTVSQADAEKLYRNLYPPGAEDLYDWSSEGTIDNLIDAEAAALKDHGWDVVDMLRAECNPRRATVTLDEWEGALGIAASATAAQVASSADRRAAIVGKWRETGAVTLQAIRDAVAPILGYSDPDDVEIVECNREGMRAEATTASGTINATIPASSVHLEVDIVPKYGNVPIDDGIVSVAGAIVDIRITHGDLSTVAFILTAPDATTQTLVPGIVGRGSVTNGDYRIYFSDVAGAQFDGTWTLSVVSSHGSTGTLVSWSLFVEACPRESFTGRSGHGGDNFTWAVIANTTLVGENPDYEGALRAIQRIQPAHSAGFLAKVDPAESDDDISVYPESNATNPPTGLALPAARPDGGGSVPTMIGSRACLPAARP